MNSKQTNNDNLLIQQIQSGDKLAFEKLYRRYFTMLCDFVYRYVHSPAVCEELMQDLFLNIWIRRNQWDPKGSVRSYLYKAARNRALDYLKHQQVEKKYLEERKIESESEWKSNKFGYDLFKTAKEKETIDEELIKAVQAAIDELPQSRKVIFTLSREDGLTYQEISHVLGISVKTVETQMGRALKYLRKRLSDFLPGLLLLSESILDLII